MRKWNITLKFAAILTIFAAIPSVGSALVLRGENDGATDQWDRFDHGTYPGSPVENSSFFGGSPIPNALHGVGWRQTNSNQSFTLITPQHIIGADHFRPNVGNAIEFFNTSGNIVSATVSSVSTVQTGGSNTDVFVAELSSALNGSGVPVVKFPSDLALASFGVGSSIRPYGFSASVGQNIVSGLQLGQSVGTLGGGGGLGNTPTFEFTFNTTGGANGDARVEVGDSGSPTFFIENGEWTVVGTHSALIGPNLGVYTSIDADLTELIDDINTTIADFGTTSYEITQVPEPNSYAVIGGLLALVPVIARRRRWAASRR
ncbi:MAG: hypothetical protein ACSHYA_18320 [Opitutaceae bacterium]